MRRAAGLLLAVMLTGGALSAHAAPNDLAGRQSDAEKQQAALRDRIENLQKDIDDREAARKEAADALKQSESAISKINLRLRELAEANRQAQADLTGLEKQIGAQQAVLAKRRTELAEQLRTQYTSGLSPWTALLSGDDPQVLGRNLGYLDYVSQARAQAVQALREDIERLAALQGRADARRAEIEKVVAETSEQKTALVGQQKERATLLAQLEGQIAAQRAEANKLGRDDQRLSRLITDLDAAIAKQIEDARRAEEARKRAEEVRRAEEARRAAEEAKKRADAERRAADEARKKAEADRKLAADNAKQAADNAKRERDARDARDAAQAREQVEAASRQNRGPVAVADPDAAGLRPAEQKQSRLTTPEPPPQAKPAEPPRKAEPIEEKPAPSRSEPAQQTQTARAAPAVGGGNGLRHGLSMPVRGQVQGRFGVDRPDGGVWRGVVLRAAEGTPVKVVAPGTVVYADWLRGFGNLIIVDHGQQYLTVYAYNQSLLKRVGDSVTGGDTIATVGATGGQVESGLYFEIRHRGAPVDPAQWLAQ
ncbi:murein hydrolase activator EnvC family protein [Achromobacter aegrifaciens]|uniref:Peptidoglycan DD-metalloendopeptidase family protein n=1 Tax=Achromobacter aegrifaciens TaxID=1287736 RepID=A0ABU2DCN3_ACHAE|nr:peptidoglycan DD-metalloendopeptidase family protein [Achromobacter aegrifaciens]MDR7945866.1 peptidoglycan DD-metalloendopeptidase family protein [Achromobacter aegrifaciens]